MVLQLKQTSSIRGVGTAEKMQIYGCNSLERKRVFWSLIRAVTVKLTIILKSRIQKMEMF